MQRALPAVMLAMVTAQTLHAADPTLPPKRLGPLLRWLRAASYRAAYIPEPDVRVSATAHGMHVRSWYSPSWSRTCAQGRYRSGRARSW